MSEALRLSSLALFAIGPVVAVLALLRRGLTPSPTQSRIKGWRWYVPVLLLPVEWLLPPVLIALRVGEIEVGWLPVRVVGLAVGLAGAVLLVWASVLLGRLMSHEAAVREDHALIERGPYRFVRHPVYVGYLALLLGSGASSLNVCLWLLWPVSFLGILIQATSEEQVLGKRFGRDYERYALRTGRLVPRLWRRASEMATDNMPKLFPFILLLVSAAARADDWPQWRGPNRDGVWHETNILESFPPGGLKVRWRARVGWGYSSPVIAKGRVYVTDCDGTLPKAKERILCFEEATGKPVWDYSTDVTYTKDTYFVDKNGRPTTPGQLPTPTPIVNSGKVYCVGMPGNVVCLDAVKGKLLWKKDLAKEYQLAEFPCPKTSPLIENDLLIVAIGGKPGACVVALNKNSGKEVWKALDDSLTHSSPIAITAGGTRQLIVWTNEAVSSLDLATGKIYWRERLLTSSEYVVSTPVFYDNLLLIGGLMLKLGPEKPVASELWPNTKAVSRRILSNTSTALIQDGYVFSAKSDGLFVCLDAKTGKQVWETDKVTDLKGGASIHLSPNGNSVFLYTDRGELILAKLSSNGYTEISRTRLLEPTYPFGGRKVAWSPPAYSNGCVFARSDKELAPPNTHRTDEYDRRLGFGDGLLQKVLKWHARRQLFRVEPGLYPLFFQVFYNFLDRFFVIPAVGNEHLVVSLLGLVYGHEMFLVDEREAAVGPQVAPRKRPVARSIHGGHPFGPLRQAIQGGTLLPIVRPRTHRVQGHVFGGSR